MLNKLLKRSLPWQQQGRWVRVYYDAIAEDVHDITFRCPSDMTYAVSQDGWGFLVTFNRPVMVDRVTQTITQVTQKNVPETNIVYPGTNPRGLLGTRGYMDMYVVYLEVI